MSIEFFAKPQPPLSGEDIVGVIQQIKNAADLIVVRDEPTSLGINYANDVYPADYEQITISMDFVQIYVAFHVGDGPQLDRVLRLVNAALKANGIRCELVED
jgi:hypothetical protein